MSVLQSKTRHIYKKTNADPDKAFVAKSIRILDEYYINLFPTLPLVYLHRKLQKQLDRLHRDGLLNPRMLA